jgi:hypothetical protein
VICNHAVEAITTTNNVARGRTVEGEEEVVPITAPKSILGTIPARAVDQQVAARSTR